MSIKFDQIVADAPEIESLRESYANWEQMINQADFAIVRDAIEQWDKSRRDTQTWHSFTHLRFNQDTRNEEYKVAREHCDQLMPKSVLLSCLS